MKQRVNIGFMLLFILILFAACNTEISEEEHNRVTISDTEEIISENTGEPDEGMETESEAGETESMLYQEFSYYLDPGYLYGDEAEGTVDIPVLFVRMPDNSTKERMINGLIVERCRGVLPTEDEWLYNTEIQVTYRSERYLCFEYVSNTPLPEDFDDTQLIFTLDIAQERWIEYPVLELQDGLGYYMNGGLEEEKKEYLEMSIEEQSQLRGETGYGLYEKEIEYGGFTFPCIQVEGMADAEVQERVNLILTEPWAAFGEVAEWNENALSGLKEDFENSKIFIACKTEQWLSVVYSIEVDYPSKQFGDGFVELGVTVNMISGERYLLDDLFEVDYLSKWLCTNVWTGYDKQKTQECLQGSVLTERELIERVSEEKNVIRVVSNYRFNWHSYYISPGKLVLFGSWWNDAEIPLPDIYQYLKVDPWFAETEYIIEKE